MTHREGQSHGGAMPKLDALTEPGSLRPLTSGDDVLPGDVETDDRAGPNLLREKDILRTHPARYVEQPALRSKPDRPRQVRDQISRSRAIVRGFAGPQAEIQHAAVVIAVALDPVLVERLDRALL